MAWPFRRRRPLPVLDATRPATVYQARTGAWAPTAVGRKVVAPAPPARRTGR